MLALSASGMAQVTTGQHIPVRSEVGPAAMPKEIAPVTAPFAFRLATIDRSRFDAATLTMKLKKGVSNKYKNAAKNRQTIQAAIDKLSAAGGGTVVIPDGQWETGRIELKNNVNLHLSNGAELHFSGLIRDYLPVVFTRDEGIEIYSLAACIYAHKAENIALTGKGKILGASTDCEIYQINKEKALNIEKITNNGEKPLEERIYDGVKNNGEVFLPKTIAPIDCKNVLIEGVTLEQGLYWNVVAQYCDGVIIRGVTVNSFGHGRTDGVDIESTKNALVEYCSLDCQDDCYTMKSGRGVDGVRVNIPTDGVVVRHCLALRGAGGIVCGTEVAGNVKNIYCHDCVFDGTDQAFRIKSLRPRGGGVQNLFVERVRANVLHYAMFCNMLGSIKWGGDLAKRYPDGVNAPKIGKYTPYFHDISVHDVIVEGCQELIHYTGLPERPVKNVFFGNATVKCDKVGFVQDASGLAMKDVQITSDDNTLFIDGCQQVSIFGVNNVSKHQPLQVVQKGVPSQYLYVEAIPEQPVKSGRGRLLRHLPG